MVSPHKKWDLSEWKLLVVWCFFATHSCFFWLIGRGTVCYNCYSYYWLTLGAIKRIKAAGIWTHDRGSFYAWLLVPAHGAKYLCKPSKQSFLGWRFAIRNHHFFGFWLPRYLTEWCRAAPTKPNPTATPWLNQCYKTQSDLLPFALQVNWPNYRIHEKMFRPLGTNLIYHLLISTH